ncbi:MAG: hypothetical protein K2X93_16660 [Candidatus Obscuribacterales bacterium]|nr:hypothetical protein [Candidatus Obscuribacterales bacterium]
MYSKSIQVRSFVVFLERIKFPLIALILSFASTTNSPACATTYYVSKNGNNQDGKTWATAWSDLWRIQSAEVKSGDTIVLDGGHTSMEYNEGLFLQNGGITITRSLEAGHNVEFKHNKVGAGVGGAGTTLDRIVAHDNQDTNITCQPSNRLNRVTISDSWIYNSLYPSTGAVSLGIESSRYKDTLLKINRCVIGPGLSTGVSVTDRVELTDCILNNASKSNLEVNSKVEGAPGTAYLKNVTSFMTNLNSQGQAHDCILRTESNPKYKTDVFVEKCIFYGGRVNVPANHFMHSTDNVQFNITGNTTTLSPTMIDPRFQSDVITVPNYASAGALNQLNFSLRPDSPAQGRGSSLSSSKSLFNQ